MNDVPTAVLVKLLRTVAKAMTSAADELHKLSVPELTPPRPPESSKPQPVPPKPPGY